VHDRIGRRAALLTTTAAVWLTCAGVARAEWMVSGYLGAVHTQTAPLAVAQPAAGTEATLQSVTYRGESFALPLYYGYRLAWFPHSNSWFGIEAEFIHLKASANTDRTTQASGRLKGRPLDAPIPIDWVIERFSISHGLNFVLVNAVARRTLGPSGAANRITLAGRFGAGPTLPHAESTIDGRSAPEGYAWGAAGWQAAGGLQIRMTRHLDVLGEYKFTRTRETVDIVSGSAKGLFASHHGVFGLAWRF
jgi:opacity protein-like surface antigen